MKKIQLNIIEAAKNNFKRKHYNLDKALKSFKEVNSFYQKLSNFWGAVHPYGKVTVKYKPSH